MQIALSRIAMSAGLDTPMTDENIARIEAERSTNTDPPRAEPENEDCYMEGVNREVRQRVRYAREVRQNEVTEPETGSAPMHERAAQRKERERNE